MLFKNALIRRKTAGLLRAEGCSSHIGMYYNAAREPAAQSKHTVQVKNPIAPNTVPMMESTRPAVAIPVGAPAATA